LFFLLGYTYNQPTSPLGWLVILIVGAWVADGIMGLTKHITQPVCDCPPPTPTYDASLDCSVSSNEDCFSSPDEDWDVICDAAVKSAKDGNAAARNWVTKNVYNDGLSVPVATQTSQDNTETTQTSKSIINDAISALVNVGYKKAQAKKEVMEQAASNKYTSVEDLLKDVMLKQSDSSESGSSMEITLVKTKDDENRWA